MEAILRVEEARWDAQTPADSAHAPRPVRMRERGEYEAMAVYRRRVDLGLVPVPVGSALWAVFSYVMARYYASG